jgi:hypothetical protein
MPTTALSILRGEVQRPFGHIEFDTTTNIASTSTVVSTELKDRYFNDDYFNGWNIIVRGARNTRLMRRVEDYAATTGTLTLTGATTQTEAGATTCELGRFWPADVERAINRVAVDSFPNLAIVRDIQLVTGYRQYTYTLPTTVRKIGKLYFGNRDPAQNHAESVLTNGGFDTWSSTTAASSWTLTGSGASVNQESTTVAPSNFAVLSDQYSARLQIAASTATTLLQTVTPDVATQGMEVNFSVWVYSTIADRVTAQISGSDVTSTPQDSDSHSGRGWELLTVSALLDNDATSFAAGVAVSSGAVMACYIDEALCSVGPSEILDREWSEMHNWRYVPSIAGASNGGKIEFSQPLPSQRRIRVLGYDHLSTVGSETATIEIDKNALIPFYARVRQYLCEERANQGGDRWNGAEWWQQQEAKYRAEYEIAISEGHRTPKQSRRMKSPYGAGV